MALLGVEDLPKLETLLFYAWFIFLLHFPESSLYQILSISQMITLKFIHFSQFLLTVTWFRPSSSLSWKSATSYKVTPLYPVSSPNSSSRLSYIAYLCSFIFCLFFHTFSIVTVWNLVSWKYYAFYLHLVWFDFVYFFLFVSLLAFLHATFSSILFCSSFNLLILLVILQALG